MHAGSLGILISVRAIENNTLCDSDKVSGCIPKPACSALGMENPLR